MECLRGLLSGAELFLAFFISLHGCLFISTLDSGQTGNMALSARVQVSAVWKNFTKTDPKTVSCNICKATLKYHGSTTAMHNHLKLHPLMASSSSSVDVGEKRQQQQTTMRDFSTRPISDQRKRQITDRLVSFIVQDTRRDHWLQRVDVASGSSSIFWSRATSSHPTGHCGATSSTSTRN